MRLPGWKRLLLQALAEAPEPPPARRWNPLPALAWWRRTLRQGGILGSPPLADASLVRLWWIAHGHPAAFVDACRERIAGASGRSRPGIETFGPLLALILVALPHLASTSSSARSNNTILQQPRLAGLDHDRQRQEWPIHSDYPEIPLAIGPDPFHAVGLQGREWLQNLPAGTHGLQLMSASNPDNLIRFCEQHRICGQSVVIPARVDGKQLWRLLLGRYADRNQARNAISSLPEALQHLKPWPRPYASLMDSSG